MSSLETTQYRLAASASASVAVLSSAAGPAISGIEPAVLATTGVPSCWASRIGKPKPSSSDG